MSWTHVDRWQTIPAAARPPIAVEQLPDGWLFVHDGRHRAEAAYDDGATLIEAQEVR